MDQFYLSRSFSASQFYFILIILLNNQLTPYYQPFSSFSSQKYSAKFVIIQMANRPKNNFSDKLKRLGCNELQKQNKNKSKQSFQQSLAGLIREKDQYIEQKISGQMLDEMRRQIDALSHKLIEAEREREKKDVQIQLLSLKIGQKNIQSTYLTQELAQSHRSIQIIRKKLEFAESELQNMRLRHKMQSITTEIGKEKPLNSPLKHQKHRKGKFSQAILPAAFGSQKKFEFHNADLLVKDEMVGQEINNNNHNFLRSPFSGYLIEEWQRTQNQRNCKQLEVANLQSKIASLKKDIAKQQKQIEALKADKPSGHELAGALQEIRQQNRRYKLVLMKLRESEKKRKDLSNMLKLKGQTVEEDNFYGFSTIADINEMIQKSAENLQIEHYVVDILVEQYQKIDQQIQTNLQDQSKQSDHYLLVIQQLKENLKKSEESLRLSNDQIKNHYEQIIQQYVSQIQHYQAKLQHYNTIISKYEAQKEPSQDMKHSVSTECSIISFKQFEQQTLIVSKIQLLMAVNQKSHQQIQLLQSQNEQLVKQVQFLSKLKNMNDKVVQVNENQFNQQQQQESGCDLCLQLKAKYYHLKQQLGRLNKIIETVSEQRNHFKHYYEESLTSCRQLQLEIQKELNKLIEKEQAYKNLAAELLQKTHQADHYKLESNQLQIKLHQQQQLKDKLQKRLQTP